MQECVTFILRKNVHQLQPFYVQTFFSFFYRKKIVYTKKMNKILSIHCHGLVEIENVKSLL